MFAKFLTLQDVADHLRVSPNEPRLEQMLNAATFHAENFLNKRIFENVDDLNQALKLGLIRKDEGVVANDLIRQAVLLVVGEFFENRENSTRYDLTSVPLSMQVLLAPYRGGLGF